MKFLIKLILKDLYYLLKRKNGRVFLKLVIYYGNKPRYKSEKVEFLSYKITVPDCLSFIWQFKEIFADESYKFNSDKLKPLIYDCGANIGISCFYFKSIYPQAKIKAFEADPKIAEILSANLKENNILDIEVLPAAVWINDNGIELGVEGADASSIYSKKNRVQINSIRLKEMIEGEQAIEMLKIDIEGAETEVLKDCKNSLESVKNIFIEYHSFTNQQQTLDEILQILKSNGFRYFIKQETDRQQPFLNRINKNNPDVDLQLNIFGYK
jgi:FkbM family methyltransferase